MAETPTAEQRAERLWRSLVAADAPMYGHAKPYVALMAQAIRAAEEAERERCAKLADLYADENRRMAGDTILHDPFLRGDRSAEAIAKSEEMIVQGCVHSATFHAAQNIAGAIRALGNEKG